MLALLAAYFFYGAFKMRESKEGIRAHVSILKDLPVVLMDSTRLVLPSKANLFIVFFHSECHHCVSELHDIKANMEQLSEFEIVLVSPEDLSQIKSFAKTNNLDQGNMIVTKILPGDAYQTFGSYSIPQVFVYDSDRRLIGEFKGTHTVSAILKKIKRMD
jgi:thioredoxin-related protein